MRRSRSVQVVLLASLACLFLAVPVAANDDELLSLQIEIAQLWLNAGRVWQQAAVITGEAGDAAAGDRYRALLYAKKSLLQARALQEYLSEDQKNSLVEQFLAVDAALDGLAELGYINMTPDELMSDYREKGMELTLVALDADYSALRFQVLSEWIRTREIWSEVEKIWAAVGEQERQAAVAAEIARIDRNVASLREGIGSERLMLTEVPEPRPVIDEIPLPMVRWYPADTTPVETADTEAAPEPRTLAGIIDIEGPLESTLVINGRKFIRMSVSSTYYPDAEDESLNTTSLDIEQQLQVHIAGKVGQTISVNVDYDDAKPEVERQTMSILYEGLEHQTPVGVMRANAAFGDISLSIPSTQFVSYNTSLFGIMGGVEVTDFNLLGMGADRVSFNALATRTKGLPGRKVFYGAATTIINDIPDISYLARKFYRVTDDSGVDVAPLSVGTLHVYVDDHDATSNDANTILAMEVSNGGDTYLGDFDELQEGPDYTVDNLTGQIKFRTNIASNYVIGVSYATEAGWDVVDKMIRDEDGSDTFDVYELRNYYDLGSLNVVVDDPEFIFEIWGSDDNPDTDTTGDGKADTTWLYYFGLDRGGLPGNDGVLGTADDLPDGKIDREWMDFDFGYVTFPDSEPFRIQNSSAYSNDPEQRFTLHLEFKQKTQSYLLGDFNIIKGSEQVSINGHPVGNDQYYIDYESGFLTFYNPDLISPNTMIVIDYQYLPFGGQFQQTAVAARTEVEFNENMLLGTTILTNWDAKENSMPTVTETPKRNLVWDVNTVVEPLDAAVDFINLFRNEELDYLSSDIATLSLSAEYAQSIHDPNTYGRASIDDLESLEEKLNLPINEESWDWATVPSELNINDRGSVSLSEISEGHDPDEDEETAKALRVSYDFSNGDTWVAIRYPFSTVSMDLSNMLYLQMWARNAADVQLGIDLGIVSEDINGDGLFQSEDVAPNDGKLNAGEDVGLDGVAGTGDYGEENGELDSEDMDGDETLDSTEAYFRLYDINALADTYVVNDWVRYRIPLYLADTVGEASWDRMKHIRLRMQMTNAAIGFVDFDLLEIAGNRWTDDNLNDTSFIVGAINTQDDPGYAPPEDILDLEDISVSDLEQSLTLTYDKLNDTGAAYYLLMEKQRYSKYRKLKYWIWGDGNGEEFFFRFGADKSNYFEQRVTINFNGWTEIQIDLPALEEQLINLYQTAAPPFNSDQGEFVFVGEPSLDTIKELRAGIYGNGTSGRIYVDEIYLDEPIKETGDVYTASFSSSYYDNIFTLNGSLTERDNKFQLMGESTESGEVEPRESRDFSLGGAIASGQLMPDDWNVGLPVNWSYSKSRTELKPETVDNVKRSDLGFSESENRSVSASLSQPNLPSISVSHSIGDNYSNNVSGINESNSRTTSMGLRYGSWPTLDMSHASSVSRVASTSQTSTSEDDNYSLNSSYSYTFPQKLFGVVPTGQNLSFSTSYSYSWAKSRSEYIIPEQIPTFNNTRTDQTGISMNIQPLANFGVSPSFNYSRVYHWSPGERGMTSRNRDGAFDFNLAGAWGFSPGLSMNSNFNESFYAQTGAGWSKDISTGGSFNFSLGMDPRAWWDKLTFLNIRYSYSNSVAATYKETPVNTSMADVYADYFRKVYWFWTDQEPTVSGDRLSLLRNSSSNTANHSIDGNLAFWSPLWFGYNFSYNRARSQSQNSITPTNTMSTGYNTRLNLKQAFPNWLENQPSNSFSHSYSYKKIEQLTALTVSHTPSLSWSVKWTDNFNTNFNFNFSQTTLDDRELHTIDRSYSPSLTLSYFFMNPFRVESPVTGGRIEFQNQLKWDNTLGYNLQTKTGDPNSDVNKYDMNASSSLSYSLRSNITASVSGNFSYHVDNIEVGVNYYNYGMSASAEIRF